MKRRHFLRLLWGSAVPVGAGAWWLSTAHARSRLQARLLAEAAPLLAGKADQERQRLPAEAREQIRTWFHAPCLNAAEFAREVGSLSFLERLRASAEPALRDQQIANAFTAKVVSEAEVLGCIQTIAEGVGADLDRGWAGCCREVAARWDTHLAPYGRTLPGDVAGRFDDMIRDKLRQAIEAARAAGELPSATETVAALGRTAILLLPLVRLPALAIPVFLFEALRPLASFILSRIDSPVEELQAAVSDRLAVLGNQVGAAFESEVRDRIDAFHRWQLEVLTAAAQDTAQQTARLFGGALW